MRRTLLTILCSCMTALALQAQTAVWESPHVGYSNNRNLSIEKVVYGKRATELHAVIEAEAGNSITLSSQTKLMTDNGESRIKKVSNIKLDQRYVMPDSGKVHVVMSFEPMSAVPDNMHFVESYEDREWKIFNIRASKHAAAEAWDELTYCDDPDLPISYFCDDSTTVNVKILNYIPEAARDIRFTYDKVDFGGEVVDGERYLISADGTATIKLHPCFPISAFMSLGDGPSALIMLMPGKDITVLIDMDEAKDGLGIKGFEGAYAKMHYEINVEGGKDLVSYTTTKAHFESLMQSNKPLSNDEHWKNYDAISSSKYSQTTKEFLNIYNDYRSLYFSYRLNYYIYERLSKAVKEISKSPSITSSIAFSDFIQNTYAQEKALFAGDRITLCPLYSTAVQYNPSSYKTLYQDANGKESSYNKSVIMLHYAIKSHLVFGASAAEKYVNQITSPELKMYYYTAMERLKQDIRDIVPVLPQNWRE